MSISAGPNSVVNGLLFDYDMSNTTRSWIGMPTTNYVTDPTHQLDGGEFSQYTDLAPIFNTYGLVPYSLSMDMKSNKGGGVLVYMQNGSTSKYSFVSQSVTTTTEWQRFTFNNLTPAISDAGATAATLAFYTGYGSGINPSVKNVQVELGTFASPFVNGIRSTNQSILDLANRSTATVSNLIYASDNTFSFNGPSSSSVSVPLSTAFNKLEGTINMWVYPTAYDGGNGYFVNRDDATPNAVDWFWLGPYSGTFYFRLGNGSDCCSNDLSVGSWASYVPLNTWTNICFTWKSAGTSAIYINGSLLTSRAISAVPSTNPSSNGRIGLGHANNYSFYTGKLPSAQIYNRQLTDQEVTQNFNAYRGRYGI